MLVHVGLPERCSLDAEEGTMKLDRRIVVGPTAPLLALALMLAASPAALAQTTAFTHQGRLTDAGTPATGIYDLQFALFDALTAGTQIGSPIALDDITVSAGLFTVSLDFGASAFPGANRWLAIGVRPGASTGAFTTLAPRQAVTSAPYAVKSVSAASADGLSVACVGCVAAARIASGQVVKSVNGLADNLTLAAGSNITITPSGNTLTIDGSGAGGGWSLAGNAGTTPGVSFLGTTDNQPFVFKTNGAEVMRLGASGNVGIGTSAPAHSLQVNGITSLGAPGGVYGFSIDNGAATGPYPSLGFNTYGYPYLAGVTGYAGILQFQDGDGTLAFYNTNTKVAAGSASQTFTRRLSILSNGNVGIGTAAPAHLLSVESSSDIAFYATSHSFWAAVVGDNTSNDSSSAGVAGSSDKGFGVYGSTIDGYAGYFLGRVQVNGELTASGRVCAANIPCASDGRLKQDVTALDYGLRDVMQLRPVRWTWKDPTERQLALGLIAQDVEAVLPELILRDADPEKPVSLNYLGLVPVVINAIQEQQTALEQEGADIRALKAENARLQQRIGDLAARLAALERSASR
jgi:hypothetical protein